MKILEDKNRIFGLDLLRCLAILFVLVAHSIASFVIPFSQNKFTAGVLGRVFSYPLGFFGVEIFFVLSGYLIGSIIIKKVIQTRSIKELFNFYIRRWFRTLPLYFLITFFLLFDPYVNYHFSWTNLVFLQNFSSALEFNPVSWSLSVEEWFYLLIPFLFTVSFVSFKKIKESRLFLFLCIFVVACSIIARMIVVSNINPTFNSGIRLSIFLRLDSLTIGVLFAGIKYYYRAIYDYFLTNRSKVFLIAFFGVFLSFLFLIFTGQLYLNESFFARVFFLPMVSIFFGLLLLCVENITTPKYFAKQVTFISLISYGIYLIHDSLFVIANNVIHISTFFESIVVMTLSILITFVVSFLLYRYFEIPIMNLRDRIRFK